ncbi:MAG: hypothetical protein PHS62_00120 [Patescibacteria group bacterium]|nr:hypothetical protein [Patescibacteria group bacterium]
MQDQLQKAINLVKKTGDKLIVFDSSKPDNAFVIMSVKDYENLVLGKSEVRGLTEDELLDKINRDIAIWKSEQVEDKDFDTSLDYFSELPVKEDKEEAREKMIRKFNKSWSIPPKRKVNAEEIIEEDRQYLEDLAF